MGHVFLPQVRGYNSSDFIINSCHDIATCVVLEVKNRAAKKTLGPIQNRHLYCLTCELKEYGYGTTPRIKQVLSTAVAHSLLATSLDHILSKTNIFCDAEPFLNRQLYPSPQLLPRPLNLLSTSEFCNTAVLQSG